MPDAVVDDLHGGAVGLGEEVDLDAAADPARIDRLERVLHDVGEDLAQLLAVRGRDHLAVHPAVRDGDTPRSTLRRRRLDARGPGCGASSYSSRSSRVSRVKSSRLLMMPSISAMPARIERAISCDRGLPSISGRGQEVGGHLDPAQGVPDLVGDARRHFPERGELLALDQPPLGLHLLGEVAQHADRAHPICPPASKMHVSGEVGGEPLAAEPPAPVDLPAPAAPRLDGVARSPSLRAGRGRRAGPGTRAGRPPPRRGRGAAAPPGSW